MNIEQLDEEWIQLVKYLMESNISKKEFRAFIDSKRMGRENNKS